MINRNSKYRHRIAIAALSLVLFGLLWGIAPRTAHADCPGGPECMPDNLPCSSRRNATTCTQECTNQNFVLECSCLWDSRNLTLIDNQCPPGEVCCWNMPCVKWDGTSEFECLRGGGSLDGLTPDRCEYKSPTGQCSCKPPLVPAGYTIDDVTVYNPNKDYTAPFDCVCPYTTLEEWLRTGVCNAPATTVTALAPAHVWIGLRTSDDQGTQFDVKVELLKNGAPVAAGTQRCITGVTRNPANAKDAVVSFGSFDPVAVASGDVLALKVSARIGTNADGSKCAGPGGSHASAGGVRLYYDAASRNSRVDLTISPDPSAALFLDSDGVACPSSGAQSAGVTTRALSSTAPTGTSAKCKDSASLSFAGGNAWKEIGTWKMTRP